MTALPAGAKSGELSWPKWLVASLVAASGVLVALWTPTLNAWATAMANRTIRSAESAAQAKDALERMPGEGKILLSEEIADRAQLGIHEALPLPEGAAEELGLSPDLPSYVPRDIDADLRATLQAMTTTGGFVLLIGPAAAGKTRCAWETIRAVLPNWHFLMPATAADLTALVSSGADLKHRVIWLNETQQFLTGTDPLRAATLRRILADRAHPTILIGTIWPDIDAQLRAPARGEEGNGAGEDLNQNSRDVLELARRFRLVSWSQKERERAEVLAASDPRIAQAARHHGPTGLTQVLSAAPELIYRWELGDNPYGQAVITAAVAARRCGHPPLLPRPLLAELAQEYLTGPQLAAAEDTWFLVALEWACEPVLHSGGIAPLQPHAEAIGQTVSYTVSDILVDHTDRDLPGAPEEIPARIWSRLIAISSVRACMSIANTAYFANRLDHAHTALQRPADAGQAVSMYNLGFLLKEQGDTEAALTSFTRAADLGNTNAMNHLGALLKEQGDTEAALTWHTRAADLGNTNAMIHLGVLLKEQGDTEAALTWHTRAADLGNISAMFNLGVLLAEQGDTEAALTWHTRAADLGNTNAMNHLGVLLKEQGNTEAALTSFTRAADLGNTNAMFNLGVLLAEQGDTEAVLTWHTRAADLGNISAMFNLGVLLAEQGDTEAALTSFTRAADLGNISAMFNLGVLLAEQGNTEAALTWHTRAADLGNISAMNNLGTLLAEQGNTEAALTSFTRAADLGDTNAMNNLGVLLAEQDDTEAALTWFTRAADLGHTNAMNNLASLKED
ncbi:tetratricopeptide repeat protein [Streptomyces kanamyceticus]|uniref:tetratricopeptide repeat protein n=1 Tax=Streptomyces kanamyceticus TaxID=1967 RepID=UPI00123CB964|nr:tetratricopeptide repeat protein [Streptomyces kanamyceticus]